MLKPKLNDQKKQIIGSRQIDVLILFIFRKIHNNYFRSPLEMLQSLISL